MVFESAGRADADADRRDGGVRLAAHQVEGARDRRSEGYAAVRRAGQARRRIDSGRAARADRERWARAAVRVARDLPHQAGGVSRDAATLTTTRPPELEKRC